MGRPRALLVLRTARGVEEIWIDGQLLEILCGKGGTERSAGKVITPPLVAEASEEETEELKEEIQELQIKYEQLEQRLEQPEKTESKRLERLREYWEQKETKGEREDLADS
jgi:hypothetical protein